MSAVFDENCTACPRLAGFLAQVRTDFPTYYARPVPAFGDLAPRLLIVGLAPGLHGANRSGRPFTGDYAGILLYQTLHQFGYASAATSVSVDDGLVLHGCRITNAVKCLPPANKPEPAEIRQCNHYLRSELQALPAGTSVLALGAVAHAAVLMASGLPAKAHKFGHGAVHDLAGGQRLYDSYHCSRYNTNTRRLTTEMFQAVFEKIKADNG
ncbi:MAG: uracil-DNA glycosylase [Sulfuriferula sp.]